MIRWIIIALCLLPVVVGTEYMETYLPGAEYTLYTPVLDCTSYTYEIYNNTANITNGTLTLVEDGIYKFNINLSAGDYIIRVCDDSTRELHVGESGNMSIAIAVILGLGLGILAYLGRNAEDKASKFAITTICLVGVWVAINFAREVAIEHGFSSAAIFSIWLIQWLTLSSVVFALGYTVFKFLLALLMHFGKVTRDKDGKLHWS